MVNAAIPAPPDRNPVIDPPHSATVVSYRPDVQGLRAIAVVMVVIYHAGLPLPGGFTGVDVFFVISGFVISRLLYGEVRSSGRLRLGKFYAGRVRRLLPILVVVLLAVLAGSALVENGLGPQQITAKTAAAASVFLANGFLVSAGGGYFDASAEGNPLLHLWTLAVEEQFYFVFPMLLVLAARRPGGWERRQRLIRRTLIATLVLSLMLSIVLAHWPDLTGLAPGTASKVAFFGSPTRAWEFLVGALLALEEDRLDHWLDRRVSAVASSAGAVLLAASAFLLRPSPAFPGVLAALPVAAAAALIIGGLRPLGLVQWVLRSQPMQWIGDRSYGWYLWHWPILVLGRKAWPGAPMAFTVLLVMGSLVVNAVTFRLVERPFRRDKTVVGVRAVRLAVALAVAGIAGSLTLFGFASRPPGNVARLASQYSAHLDQLPACQGQLPHDGYVPGCTWSAEASAGTILLLGDSNAGQFAEGVRAAAHDLGYTFSMAAFSGCLPLELRMEYTTVPFASDSCSEFGQKWRKEVLANKPAVVILATSSADYLSNPMVRLGLPPEPTVSSPSARAKIYEAALRSFASTLSSDQVPLLIVHPMPHFPDFDLRSCPTFQVVADYGSCSRGMTKTTADEQVREAFDAENRAAVGIEGVGLLDLRGEYCDPLQCRTYRDGIYLFRDGSHISVDFSQELTPRFVSALRPLLPL